MANEKNYRIETDLLGELKVPAEALYGVQTQRGINNYHISRKTMRDYPDFIIANAYVKLAAAQTNHSLGVISDEIASSMSQACREIIDGQWHENFPIDMIQGGAGTSVNMNINEVIANRALEILGHEKGEYQYCSPNDHANCGQSTNDAYPTAIRYALIRMNAHLVGALITKTEMVGYLAYSHIRMRQQIAYLLIDQRRGMLIDCRTTYFLYQSGKVSCRDIEHISIETYLALLAEITIKMMKEYLIHLLLVTKVMRDRALLVRQFIDDKLQDIEHTAYHLYLIDVLMAHYIANKMEDV